MSDLRELYQEVILDHSRQPRNFRRPDHANREAKGDNPLCGDKVTVYLLVEDGVVRDVRFEGRGCAISMASASMMTETLKGRSAAEAAALFERFHLYDGHGDALLYWFDEISAQIRSGIMGICAGNSASGPRASATAFAIAAAGPLMPISPAPPSGAKTSSSAGDVICVVNSCRLVGWVER